jgi:type II secretory pathway component PulF
MKTLVTTVYTYKCTVADSSGKTKIMYRTGTNKDEVISSFSGSSFIPVKIEFLSRKNSNHSSRKKAKMVLEFTQMMEMLLDSGLSIKDSLEITSLIGTKKDDCGELAGELLSEIRKGITFAKAVSNMDTIFPSVYRGIISVGDHVGSVERIFPRLRMYLETSKKLRDKFVSALIYPCLVFFIAVIGMTGLAVFVFPKLETMFSEFGGEAAVLLQNNIHKLQAGIVAFIICLLLAIITVLIIKKTAERDTTIKARLDGLSLRCPVIGKFNAEWQTLNFAFAMETLTAGGVTIETAISEAESVITNEAYKNALSDVTSDIIKGTSISEAFSNHQEFPSYMSKWLMVGERSGKTEQVFAQIRTYFQSDIEKYTSWFMSLIEPALIILVGLLLLVLVITIIVPIFSLYGTIL